MEGTLDFPPWVDLPDPVAELILKHLPLPDYIRFAAVCRKWGSIQKEHRLRHSPHPPPMGTHPLPWLFPRILSLGTKFHCYSPLEKRLRRLRFPTIPTLPGRTLCMASFCGWLLLLEVDEGYDLGPIDDNPTPKRLFLFNPLTGAVISLPVISLPMLSIVSDIGLFGALSSSPYDSDCTILLVSAGSVFLCRSNDPGDGWTMGVGIEEWIDSAVYCAGKFYCITRKGVLYVIDGVRSTPTLLHLTMDVSALALDIRDGNSLRLVEFGGELLLVMKSYYWHRRHEGLQVFRADLSGEKWVNKEMLTDHVLFLDGRCSLSLLASDVGCKKNRIYCTSELGCHDCRVFDLDTRNWIHDEMVRRDRFSRESRWERWFLPILG